MTSKEFTMWLKGFMTAADQSQPTHTNWVLIKEELSKVQDHHECQCGKKTYTYPYQGYAGDITITNTSSKQTLND